MEEVKPISMDAEAGEPLKFAVMALLNGFPGLNGREITWQGLTFDSGISVEPESGPLVYATQTDILGTVYQQCQFPFFVVYRSGASTEFQKMNVTQFLDNLGAWISGEPVTVDGNAYRLTDYPALDGARKIERITRSNTYAMEKNENRTQDWVLPVSVSYTHTFQKR